MDKYFGQTMGKLGFGLMRLPKIDEKEFDLPQICGMVDRFMEEGFNYFDTSWGYQGSEEVFKKTIGDRYPRDKYLIATKCPVWMAESKEQARNMLSVSLQRMGLDYVDFYLLHNLGENRTHFFDDYDIWNLVQEQKAKGLIRHVGFSFHDKAEALEKIIKEHPELEFVQLQINYGDWENPSVESKKCYEVARKYELPIVIMEPLKGGTLARPPQAIGELLKGYNPKASIASWGVRFGASLEGVMTVLSGMSDLNQMEDNLSYMKSLIPMNAMELEILEKARGILKQYSNIPCTACGYCMEVCPQKVAIPGIFEALNIKDMYDNMDRTQLTYGWQTEGHGLNKASACVKCGKCEMSCPQHIGIRKELERAVALLEK